MKTIARLFRITDVFLILAVILYALPAQAGQTKIIVFDPPGSTSTNPNDINPAGEIAGSYTDANHTPRGFLRTVGGAIASFAYPTTAQFVVSTFINPAGVITGNYGYHGECTLPSASTADGSRLRKMNCASSGMRTLSHYL
jgi:hypothetical protein